MAKNVKVHTSEANDGSTKSTLLKFWNSTSLFGMKNSTLCIGGASLLGVILLVCLLRKD